MPGFGSSYKPTASPYGPAGAGVAGSFRPGGGGGGLAGPYRPAGGAMAGGNPHLYGLAPNQSRAAMVGSDIAGHGALSQGLMEADYQEATANRPFLQNLLSGQIGYEQQRRMQREAQRAQERAMLGQLAGQALGA